MVQHYQFIIYFTYFKLKEIMKQILRSLAVLVAFLAPVLLRGQAVQSHSLYIEDFTAASGAITANGWTAFSSAGTSAISISSLGLSFSGAPSSGIGNSVSMTTSGEDDYNTTAFTTQTESASPGTSVYASFLINVSAAQSTGDYFFSFYNTSGTAGFSGGRVFIKSSGGGFVMSVGKTATPATYASTVLSFSTTYLVVVKHTMISATMTDDVSKLWFFASTIPTSETSADVTDNSSGTDPNTSGVAKCNRVALRQGAAGNAATLKVDGIRVGTTWQSVTSLSVGTLSSAYTQAATLSVPVVSYGAYNSGNTFTVQLSDAAGSFTSPTTIGSASGTSSTSIACTIPEAQTIGSGYRIRVVASDPSVIGADNGSNISIIAPTNYYYKGSGDLATTTNWGTNTDGTGSNPPDFVSNAQVFNIRTNATTTTALTVAGTASKIIVGDPSVSAVTLTIASGFGITTTSPVVLDIAQALSGSNSVVLQDATTTPSFGTMHSASEVHYQATISTGTTKTFGKLFVDGSGTTTTFSGTPVVQTSLTVASGSTMATGNLSSNFVTLNSGASVTIIGTFKTQKSPGFTSANVVTAGSSFAAIQFIGAENLTLGAASTIEYNRTSSGTAQTITARTDYANLILSDAGVANNKTFAGITTVSGNLTLNFSASTATAGRAITTGTLTLTAGKLTLGANDLTATTLSGGSSTSYIVTDAAGKLISPTSAGVLKTFPIGASTTSYDPVDVTPTNGVTFSAKVATSFVNAVSDNTKVAAREWNVSATGAGSTVMSLTNGGTVYTPTTARIGHYTGSAWEEFAATFSANTWTATNASGSFSPFGGGNLGAFNSAVLAVELQSFAALAKGRANELTWTTSQEKNHESFIIERSFDGKDFKTIGTVKSQGASSVEKVYHFTDDNPLSISYYRLKMQDVNGTEQVSKTVAVNRNDSKTYVLECYPSVVHDKITVLYAASENALLTVTNLLGQVVLKKDLTASLSPNAFDLDLSNLSKGLYLLRLDNNQTHLLKKIITE